MSKELEAWEGEGGAVLFPLLPSQVQISGTVNQVEWANRIRLNVNAEFDRVAASFRLIAGKQMDGKRADTDAIVAILEEKRAAVMSRDQAGYFIHDWQEINDQVRQMISRDPRFQKIKSRRKANLGNTHEYQTFV